MTPRTSINRRTFLRGAFGITLALPLLDAMVPEPARADMPKPPKRFIAMFSPNGTVAEAWSPEGSETDFTFGEILSPLLPHKGDVIVLEGVQMSSTKKGPGSAHMKGVGHLLTGRELLQGSFYGGAGETSGWGSGISVDQEMANHDFIRGTSKFKSLELGVRVVTGDVRGRISYRGSGDPLPPVEDPKKAFSMLFGDIGLDPAAIEGLRLDRQSVIDFVKEDFEALHRKLGSADRQKLEKHLATVREIEARLATLGTTVCAAPDIGVGVELSDANAPLIGQLLMDILVAALACDLTRVASFMWMRGTGPHPFPWLGISDAHHDLSHEPDDNAAAKDKLIKINKWYAEQFAYLLAQMKAIKEPDGSTLLDNSLVLWGNELGKGNTHSRDDIPFVLAGSAGGYFKTGRYISYADDPPHNNLLVSALNAMGVPTSTFGDPAFCTGPLSKLVG